MKIMKMTAVVTTYHGTTGVSTSTRRACQLMTFISVASINAHARLVEMEVVAMPTRMTMGQGNMAARSRILLCATVFASHSAGMMWGGIVIDLLCRPVTRNPLHLSRMRSCRFMCRITRPMPCHRQWTRAVRMCGRIPM
jgi:hypothetical protein